jgi:hypothetical protein
MRLNRLIPFVLSVLLVGALSPRAFAQTAVTQADIQRLQDGIADATRDIGQTRARDAGLADQLQRELDDVRDQTTYLKVKLQRNEAIARGEYSDLRERIDNIRDRARGEAVGGYTPPRRQAKRRRNRGRRRPGAPHEIPVGTEFDVRLQSGLSSDNAQVEDRFDATTLVDLQDERGRVSSQPARSSARRHRQPVTRATRTGSAPAS